MSSFSYIASLNYMLNPSCSTTFGLDPVNGADVTFTGLGRAIKKHAGFKMNPRVKLHFINKLKTK
jgi:hypothetical protein